jgi:uncharacterized metal-binding protein
MPSGKTHDAITFILAIPTLAIAWTASRSFSFAAIVTATFLFGGLMFGPDLDTASKQYSRWSVFSFLWLPYRMFFKHRSRWSHGLVFGTMIRVIYFLGALTIAAFSISYLVLTYTGGELPDFISFTNSWQGIGKYVRAEIGEHVLLFAFLGLWLGAASHSFTDLAGSFIKTGKVGGVF